MVKKASDLSSAASDIDMEELGQSLEEAQSIQRQSPEGRESEDRMPYIRPLEYEESDFESESSELAPLSIIQEEDEEDLLEEISFPRTHSASEGFDDDVVDLLDKDHDREQSSGRAVDFGSVRRISQTEGAPALNTNEPLDGLGFGKYLVNSTDKPKTNSAHDSPYRLMDSIKLEESEGEAVDNDGIDITYSDTEADRGVERSSTPLDGEYEEGMVQEETPHHATYDEATPATEGQAASDQGYVDKVAPEEQVRVFLALCDYDPGSMSPNPDAEEEELAFNEGDLIKVREGVVMLI